MGVLKFEYFKSGSC